MKVLFQTENQANFAKNMIDDIYFFDEVFFSQFFPFLAFNYLLTCFLKKIKLCYDNDKIHTLI